jgi:hypothetical protein
MILRSSPRRLRWRAPNAECGGGLWELIEAKPPRFQCHTGHAYSLITLAQGMKNKTEENFWAACVPCRSARSSAGGWRWKLSGWGRRKRV